MSWIRIWIHIVFSTKNREPLLSTKEKRYKTFTHMRLKAREDNIWVDCINGYDDHVHCLLSLKSSQPLDDIVQNLKGESSNWINQNLQLKDYFSWQDDFWAVSVSESDVNKVRKYIHNQEKHHTHQTFAEEIDLLKMNKFSVQFNPSAKADGN
jgi:putative transposase